jgi:Na+-transporting NADH:ubiquinone oxidoreductase subunit C
MKEKFSNKYIYIYSTVLVVIVAAILAIIAVGLKPYQDKNIRVEKMQQLLGAVHISSTVNNAETLYNKYFTKEYAVDSQGKIVSSYINGQKQGKIRPFEINVKDEYKKLKTKQNGVILPVYVCEKEGKQYFVVPVRGAGLWGDIWGNVALKDDMTTVEGVNFDHESETPGLGAEITTQKFQSKFQNKTIFEGNIFTSIAVEKRADMKDSHKVDALSGATLTSKGVSAMLNDCLRFYIPYFNTLKTK